MKIRLTCEQQDFVTKNHNLILSFLRTKKLPIWETDEIYGEDWYGIAAIGLCKAAAVFDETRGYSFSTVAYKIMNNEVLHTLKKYNSQKAIPHAAILSYEKTFVEEEDNLTFADVCLVDKQNKYDDLITIQACKTVFDTLSERDKTIVYLLMVGYTQGEVCKKFNISQPTVSRIKKRFIESLG